MRRIIFPSSLESKTDSSEENHFYNDKSENIRNTDVVKNIQIDEGGYINRQFESRNMRSGIKNQYSFEKLKKAVIYGNDIPRLFGIFGRYYEEYMAKYMSMLSAKPCRILDSIYLDDIESCTYECIVAQITTRFGLPVPTSPRNTTSLEELTGRLDYKVIIEDLCYTFWKNEQNIMVIPIKLKDNCLNYRMLSMLYAIKSENLIFILGSNMSEEIQIRELGGTEIFYKYFGVETVFYADEK